MMMTPLLLIITPRLVNDVAEILFTPLDYLLPFAAAAIIDYAIMPADVDALFAIRRHCYMPRYTLPPYDEA